MLDKVEAGAMPPKDETQPTKDERAAMVTWLRDDYTHRLLEAQRAEGRSKLRRLTRTEYANTVFDILGIRPPAMRILPADGRVDGYDKVGAALPLSAEGAAGYLKMADDILQLLLQPHPKNLPNRTHRLWGKESGQSPGHTLVLDDQTFVSFNSDTTSGNLGAKEIYPMPLKPEGKPVYFPGAGIPGMHHIRSLLRYLPTQTDKPLAFGIYAGHVWSYPQVLDLLQVLEAPPGKPAVLEADVYLRTGNNSDLGITDGLRLIPFGLGVPVPKNTLAKLCKATRPRRTAMGRCGGT